MEEETLYDRIGEADLNPTYKDGQVYQHTDVNNMLSILKTAVNENYYDIQKLENGTKDVEKAKTLDDATLSRYLDETLQADDNKVPSSQQAKAYMDNLFAEYSPPIRGVDYWTDEDKQEIIDEAASDAQLKLKGEYDPTVQYSKLDTVLYQGSSYVALQTVQGQVPTNTEYWQKLVTGGMDIIDNLESEDTQKALSANQGKILNDKIEKNPLGSLNFREIQEYKASENDLYQSYSHCQLQGFCQIEDNIIIMGLRNPYNVDNIVNLIEYNISTASVLRNSYLELNHCNSIAYDEENKKLYIAATSKLENGELVNDNDIIVVDYETLSIENIIEISNLGTERIRSVFYDNNTNILYGGNSNTIFKINLSTNTISDTVTLDTTYLQPNSTNQVLKKYNNYYVGLNISNLIFWNLDGTIFKEINVDRVQENLTLGEVQDFFIKENGDIILGTTKRLNDLTSYLSATFYYSNIYTNTNNVVRTTLGGNANRFIEVYCNNLSNTNIEDGTSNYPFKTLAKAILFITNSSRSCLLHILGGEYNEDIVIRGLNNVDIIFENNITLKALVLINSKLNLNNNDNDITINGLRMINSDISIVGSSSHHYTLNYMNNTNYSDYCIYAENSRIYMRYVDLVGSNAHNMVEVVNNSELTLDSCTFTNYTSYLAIKGQNQCLINLKGNTFNTPSSASQHLIQLRYSTILNTQNNLTSINDYDKDIYSKIYGVRVIETLPATIYYGDVCATHKEYQFAKAKSTVAGLNNTYLYTDFKTKNAQNDRYMITSVWGNNVSLKNVLADFRCYNDKITIMDNRRIVLDGSTYTYSALSEQPESATGDYVGIVAIEYYDM